MATFSSGAQQIMTNWNFVSSFDMHKPDISNTVEKVRGSQTLSGLLRMVGNTKETDSLKYKSWEEDWIMPKIKATTAGAIAGAAATFTLDSTDMSQISNTNSPYTATGSTQTIPVQAGNHILVKPSTGINGGSMIRMIVQSVNASAGTFVAYPFDPAQVTPVISSADEIVIYSNSSGEGTFQPLSLNSKVFSRENNLQIIKATHSVTGSEMGAVTWAEFEGKSYWHAKGESDTQKRFDNYKELTGVLGDHITNGTWINLAGNPDNGTNIATQGLIPFILGSGNQVTYSGITGVTLADFEAMTLILNKERGSRQNLIEAGLPLSIQIDNILGDRFKEGGFSYGSATFDTAKAVDLSFSKFKIGEYTFVKQTYDLFTDQQTLGAAGFPFQNEAMIIPMDSKVLSVDGKTENVPALRLRYMKDRENVVTAVNRMEVDGKDQFDFFYLSHEGMEMYGANRYVYLKK